MQVPDGVTAPPDRQTNMALGGRALPFVMTVQPGSTGKLRTVLANEAGSVRANVGGPKISSQGDGWHFEEAG